MSAEQNNIQDSFLNQLRREREPALITLTNGFKIKGRIKGFDRFAILVEAGESEQIIFKHAVSSIAVKKAFSNKLRIAKVAPKEEKKGKQDQEKPKPEDPKSDETQ